MTVLAQIIRWTICSSGMVSRGKASYKSLKNFYDVANSLLKDKRCFYTKEEVEALKLDSNNTFIRGE